MCSVYVSLFLQKIQIQRTFTRPQKHRLNVVWLCFKKCFSTRQVRFSNGAFLNSQTDTADFPAEILFPRLTIDQGMMGSTLKGSTIGSETSIFTNQLQEYHEKDNKPVKDEVVLSFLDILI